MQLTRAIATCALVLAIALAIGAMQPANPSANAGASNPIIILATMQPAIAPTPALPTAPAELAQFDQQPAAPAELAQAQPEVVYIYLPAAPVEQLPAAPVEQLPAAPVEQLPAATVEQLPAAPVDPATIPGTPEFNAALAEITNSLPTLKCPCGNDSSAPAPISDRDRAYSRARTR